MGIYVNPGNAAFRKALNSEIYVDKTELIAVTNRRIYGCGHACGLLQ